MKATLLIFAVVMGQSVLAADKEKPLIADPVVKKQAASQKSPVRIVTSSNRGIFPKSWITAEINATAEVLQESETERSIKILNKAMRKYPKRVLTINLETIYVLGKLNYKGISAAGTNSRKNIYIANRGRRKGYSDSKIEGTFHKEFSSILLRNFPQHLDKDAWTKANVKSFKYGKSGVEAVKRGKAGVVLDESLYAKGFLYEYAKSTLENDFNSIAGELFLGDGRFWAAVNKHQRIKKKTDLVIAFYHKINPLFNREFFVSLAEPDANATAPARPKN